MVGVSVLKNSQGKTVAFTVNVEEHDPKINALVMAVLDDDNDEDDFFSALGTNAIQMLADDDEEYEYQLKDGRQKTANRKA